MESCAWIPAYLLSGSCSPNPSPLGVAGTAVSGQCWYVSMGLTCSPDTLKKTKKTQPQKPFHFGMASDKSFLVYNKSNISPWCCK